MRLEGKVAIITGASSGMGREIARLFAKEGAKVVALARRTERLEELSKEAKDEGNVIYPFTCDVGKEEDINAAVKETLKEFGKIDILINNAGIMDDMKPLTELDNDLWERVMSINLTAVMKFSREVLKIMLENGGGNIINTASVGGLMGCRAGAAYTASKHAVVGLTKNIAQMYDDQNIRCNAICPGGINTEIAEKGMANVSELGLKKATAGAATSYRVGEPIEVAYTALFLASDEASYINGVALPVDGGFIAY
ncbi:MAG TPA: glucose 1-dehydrogenase [Candidatus Dorea intestinavium]|nr:glucose 1-dehydrogenase [Candidatus Dorea intestinavium]